MKAIAGKKDITKMNEFPVNVIEMFKCPDCGSEKLEGKQDHLYCPNCKAKWAVREGIYDFRQSMEVK